METKAQRYQDLRKPRKSVTNVRREAKPTNSKPVALASGIQRRIANHKSISQVLISHL